MGLTSVFTEHACVPLYFPANFSWNVFRYIKFMYYVEGMLVSSNDCTKEQFETNLPHRPILRQINLVEKGQASKSIIDYDATKLTVNVIQG